MRIKKRGSSLITVVIIFSILITVGTAMLSMTVGDYKMRVKESKQIANLYSSDSGLDVAYDIIVKTFDGAAKFGDFKARQLKEGECTGGPNLQKYNDAKNVLEEVKKNHTKGTEKDRRAIRAAEKRFNETIEKLSDEEFKRCFRVFISKVESPDPDSEGDIPNNILAYSIWNQKYINIDLSNKKITVPIDSSDFKYTSSINFGENIVKPELFVCSNEKLSKLKQIVQEDENKEILKSIKGDTGGIYYDSSNEIFNIKVTSKFIDKGRNSNDMTKNNLRILQANYEIKVPEYKDVSFKESTAVVGTYDKVKEMPIIVGKDLKIDGTGLTDQFKFEVNGDIFVQGNKIKDISNKVYDKYKGGININQSKVNFNGNVSTASTFLIQDNSIVNVNKNLEAKDSEKTGNLYALNIYAGRLDGKYANEYNTSANSCLTVNGDATLDNDLTLKGINTNIGVKKFYGLNDKNKNGKTTNEPLERTSSSIIVNGNRNSGVEVIEEAYIMGVAHIDDKNNNFSYTTGESTGVKGNYIAYAQEEYDEYNPNNYIKTNLEEKKKKFFNYWDDKKEIVNTGGIKLPEKTHAIGAIVYKDQDGNSVVKDGYTIGEGSLEINQKKEEYAAKVYNLGKTTSDDMKLYEAKDDNKNPIDSLINLYNIPDSYDLDKALLESNKAIFNNADKTIVINGENSMDLNIAGNIIEINTKGKVLNAFIATSGDVYINGNVNFNGSIISEGNLYVIGNGNKTITYDNNVITSLYNKNKDIFDKVFVDDITELEEDEDLNQSFIDVNYDLNKFLSTRLWKIIR